MKGIVVAVHPTRGTTAVNIGEGNFAVLECEECVFRVNDIITGIRDDLFTQEVVNVTQGTRHTVMVESTDSTRKHALGFTR
ncbi:hypothetical protein [Halodesulfovibrio aestuarii]|uniref:Uncharacterized protein n=1 Tax=Halodesulfovibrio aestuarii TaxID=126333 RepID=A0ABV4JU40_9BACT